MPGSASFSSSNKYQEFPSDLKIGTLVSTLLRALSYSVSAEIGLCPAAGLVLFGVSAEISFYPAACLVLFRQC